MEEEKLNNLIYLLRIHHIDSEPLENLIKGYKELEKENEEMLENSLDVINNMIPKSKVREFFEEKSKVVKSESKDKTYLLIDVTELNEELLQEGKINETKM